MKIRIIDGYKVKECPFCGKVSTVDFADVKAEEYFVVCSLAKGGCGGSGAWASDKETAVKRWNRRDGK